MQGNTTAKANRQLAEILGSNALRESNMLRWFQIFKDGNYDITTHQGSDSHPEPETEQRVEDIQEAIL